MTVGQTIDWGRQQAVIPNLHRKELERQATKGDGLPYGQIHFFRSSQTFIICVRLT